MKGSGGNPRRAQRVNRGTDVYLAAGIGDKSRLNYPNTVVVRRVSGRPGHNKHRGCARRHNAKRPARNIIYLRSAPAQCAPRSASALCTPERRRVNAAAPLSLSRGSLPPGKKARRSRCPSCMTPALSLRKGCRRCPARRPRSFDIIMFRTARLSLSPVRGVASPAAAIFYHSCGVREVWLGRARENRKNGKEH